MLPNPGIFHHNLFVSWIQEHELAFSAAKAFRDAATQIYPAFLLDTCVISRVIPRHMFIIENVILMCAERFSDPGIWSVYFTQQNILIKMMLRKHFAVGLWNSSLENIFIKTKQEKEKKKTRKISTPNVLKLSENCRMGWGKKRKYFLFCSGLGLSRKHSV